MISGITNKEMNMKTKLLTLLLMLLCLTAFAQNDLKARIEYEDAETAFAAEDYIKAITHLTEAEKLLGKWTPKVGYLMVISLDKNLDYSAPKEEILKTLRFHIDRYLKYADNNNIALEKAKEVIAIDKILQPVEKKIVYQKNTDYLKGLEEFKAKRYDEAIVYFKKATVNGNKLAEAMLGNTYVWKKQPKEALEIYHNAVDKGNSYAMKNLANLYFYGEEGIEKDLDKGLYFYKKAAELGNIDVIDDLIFLYSGQKSFKQDLNEMQKWAETSVKMGSSRGYEWLSGLYFGGHKVDKDENKALHYAKISATKGSSLAMLKVSEIYLSQGRCQDAINWALKSVEKLYLGYKHLSLIYKDGCADLQKDILKANEYERKYVEERNKILNY